MIPAHNNSSAYKTYSFTLFTVHKALLAYGCRSAETMPMATKLSTVLAEHPYLGIIPQILTTHGHPMTVHSHIILTKKSFLDY